VDHQPASGLRNRPTIVEPPASPPPMERLLYEVKKVIVGQDHLLERMAVALLADRKSTRLNSSHQI